MLKAKIKVLSKFNNLLIKKGKKANAFSLVLKTLFLLKKKTKKNPLFIITNVLKTLTPGVTTKKTVIAGRLYHLPSGITRNKALYFSCNWLQQAAIENKELQNKSLDFKIAEECFRVLKKKAQSLSLLKQHNKVVSENRPFLRFVRKKFSKRLSRKAWLRKRKLLWLSRRKIKRPKYYTTFDFMFNRWNNRYDRRIVFDARKYGPKSSTRISKTLDRFEKLSIAKAGRRYNSVARRSKLPRTKVYKLRRVKALIQARVILKKVYGENFENKKANKKNKKKLREKSRKNNKSLQKNIRKKNISIPKLQTRRL